VTINVSFRPSGIRMGEGPGVIRGVRLAIIMALSPELW
jgi:hypothetical protein